MCYTLIRGSHSLGSGTSNKVSQVLRRIKSGTHVIITADC